MCIRDSVWAFSFIFFVQIIAENVFYKAPLQMCIRDRYDSAERLVSVLTCPQGHTLGDISDWAIKKLLKLGFTDMDIEMLERLGVTDADARQIIELSLIHI